MNTLARVALVLLSLAAPVADASGGEVRLLVSIAANVGDPEDTPLRYADDDAERVRRLLVDLGDVSADRAYLVVNQPAGVVRERLAEVAGRIAELRAAGRDVVLLLYVSAHARAGVLHLMGTHLPLSELRDFAARSGARLRVLLVDACDSGAIARQKGGRRGAGFEVRLEQLPLRGQVIVTSSGPAQASEEWDALEGSLFTHHLLTGLRGDADLEGDGRVTLNEAYAYAYRRTVASAARDGQHPAYDFDLSGSGELVLTEPRRAQSALLFGPELAGDFVVASVPAAHVVSEVRKERGRAVRLAVPAGRYLVRKREGRSAGLLEVELPYGGERAVREEALQWRDYTEIALKGGALALRPWAVMLLASAQPALVEGTPWPLRPALALRRTEGAWWISATLGGHQSSYRGVELSVRERALGLGLAVGHRWLSWPVIPHLGLGLELVGVEQAFTRDREDDIQRVFGNGALPSRHALAIALGGVLGIEVPLLASSFAWGQTRVGVRHLPASSQPALRVDLQGLAGAGLRF